MWSLLFLSSIFLFKTLWSSHPSNTPDVTRNRHTSSGPSTINLEILSKIKERESQKLIFAFAQGLVSILKHGNDSEACTWGEAEPGSFSRCVTTASVLLLLLIKLVYLTRKLIAYYVRRRDQGIPTS